jgi:hypothetical protein
MVKVTGGASRDGGNLLKTPFTFECGHQAYSFILEVFSPYHPEVALDQRPPP